MNLNILFPPEVTLWLMHYGMFLVMSLFILLGIILMLRPFWVWYTGQSQANDQLKKLLEIQIKSLNELEKLNAILSMPFKKTQKNQKNQKNSYPPSPTSTEPYKIGEDEKKAILDALAQSRKKKPPIE